MQDKNIKWKYQVHLKWNSEAAVKYQVQMHWMKYQFALEKSHRFKGYNYWPVFLIKYFNNFIKYFHKFITSYHRQKKFAWHPVYACADQDCMHVSLAGRGWLVLELYSYSDKPVPPLSSEIATSRTCLTWVSCFYYLREWDTHTIWRLSFELCNKAWDAVQALVQLFIHHKACVARHIRHAHKSQVILIEFLAHARTSSITIIQAHYYRVMRTVNVYW